MATQTCHSGFWSCQAVAEQRHVVHQHCEYLWIGKKHLLTSTAFSPVPTSLRLQLLRFVLIRSSSILFYRHPTTIDRTNNPKLDAYTTFPGIPASGRSSIIPVIAPLDQSRQTTEAYSHALVTSSDIFSSSSSCSSGNITQSGSEWSHLRCAYSDGMCLSRFACGNHFRPFHQLSHRSGCRRNGRNRFARFDTWMEVSHFGSN